MYSQTGLRPLANLVALDFLSIYSSRGRIRYSYIAALNQAKRLLGHDGYVPLLRLLLEFGPQVFSEEKFKKEVMAKYPEYGLVAGGLLSFASHGAGVMACHARFAKSFGYASLPEAIPIQLGLQIADLHHRDNLNNPAVLMRITVDPLIARLRQFPEQPILNMSLQVGTIALIHKRRNVYTAYDATYEERQAALLTYGQEQSPESGQPRYHFYDPAFYSYQEVEGHGQVVSKATG
ncbi:MAG TPA: hypothetical protein PKE45_25365, partial [Caldilineaceae bacterium]|nr:hypothetical protein [Caldilineaceae bacterium]